MKQKKVIVTRPQAQAVPLADKLRQAGWETIIFPLLDISPVSDTASAECCVRRLPEYAVAVFVSPNAVAGFLPQVGEWPPGVAIAVVGSGSKRALLQAGIDESRVRIISPDDPRHMDSEALLARLDLAGLRGKKVLFVRATAGREFLSEALQAAGAQVDMLAVYERTAPAFDTARRVALRSCLAQPAHWLISSSEALRILYAWCQEMEAEEAEYPALQLLRQQHIVVSHQRIWETAKNLGLESVTLTPSGDEAMLVALQSRI